MKKRKKILIRIIIVLVAFLISSVLLFNISKMRDFQFFGEVINKVDTNEKKVALTFDDGPTENTEHILDKLDELDIKATFFLCGIGIDDRKEDSKEIVKREHCIGNHSYSHKRMIGVSYNFCKDEIEKTNALIREIGYEKEIYFRAPYFKKLFALPLYLNNTNMISVTCDVEPETFLGYDAASDELASYVIENVENGSIILMHPMYNDNSLEAVEKIVLELKKQGYTFCKLDELINSK